MYRISEITQEKRRWGASGLGQNAVKSQGVFSLCTAPFLEEVRDGIIEKEATLANDILDVLFKVPGNKVTYHTHKDARTRIHNEFLV